MTALKKILLSKVFFSALAFQLAWFALILFPLWLACAALAAYLVFHFRFVSSDRVLWIFSLQIFFIGLAVDSFFFYSNIIMTDDQLRVVPLWLVGLWLCFSLALPFGFAFLQKHYALCASFGFLGAPISYYSGALLRGDVSFLEPVWLSLLYIGISWAVLLCFAVFLLKKIDDNNVNAAYAQPLSPQDLS